MTETGKRRRRYRGSHPRHFAEKYKELQGDPGAVAHAVAKGRTPAGQHRPVMADEVLQALAPRPGETFLDATLGYGGHASLLLPYLLPGGKLFALDVDSRERPRTEARLRAQGFGPDVLDVRALNFAQLEHLLPDVGGGFAGILADLGVSSMQLDDPDRGFSYKAQGALDLRLDPSRGMTAADFLPEHLPERVMRATLQRVFMALRLAVNEELTALATLLAALPRCLRAGGRVAILTFHPGDAQRVAAALAAGARAGVYARVDPVMRPSATEQRENPRSACARLHCAVRN